MAKQTSIKEVQAEATLAFWQTAKCSAEYIEAMLKNPTLDGDLAKLQAASHVLETAFKPVPKS
ncbi:MAG: hypothetical protein RMY16_14430 [Nostoc sp. DedQUE12b]|uniref:hypothetical protein n=1 Tax=Nostoc sp. DedQUE12b TaxID=3075398 RepID=UPI002AD52842|nr:hypothetical protein [Nostoc sp. DedQUE12b]MDZ8086734.1 hypothetical protein [Nostoc sp. DedQUE12b]